MSSYSFLIEKTPLLIGVLIGRFLLKNVSIATPFLAYGSIILSLSILTLVTYKQRLLPRYNEL